MTNVGLMSFLLNEPSEQVLQYYSLSDTLALELKDSLVLSMVNNRIGLCYRGLNKLELAEKYLLKSIDYAKNGNAPNYFALSDLYVLLGDVEKSKTCHPHRWGGGCIDDHVVEVLWCKSFVDESFQGKLSTFSGNHF